MNRTRTLLAGIAIVSLAVAASRQGILLRRVLTENSTDVYALTTDMKQAISVGGMDQDMGITSSMKLTMKTGKVDKEKGTAEVETVYSDIKTQADGAAAAAVNSGDAPKEIKNNGTLDQRGRLLLKAVKATNPMEMMVGGASSNSAMTFVEFPEKEVNVGDAWTITLPKSPVFGNKEQTMTAKLTGEKDYEGSKVWVISVAGKLKLEADLGEMMKDQPDNPMAGMKANMKGDIDLTGEALVDQKTGKTVVYKTDSKSKTTVEIVDAGMTVESTGTTKTTMTLQK